MPRPKKKDPSAPPPEATHGTPHLPRIATVFQALQRDRVGLERSLETKKDVYDPDAQKILDLLKEAERQSVTYLRRGCEASPIWTRLQNVPGIGLRLGGMLVGLIDIEQCDTASALWRYAGLGTVPTTAMPCNHVGAKGKHCPWVATSSTVEATRSRLADHLSRRHKMPYGEAKVQAEQAEFSSRNLAEKRVTGEQLHYNNTLKKTCFLIARSFVIGKHQPYERFYREAKDKYIREHGPGTKEEWTPQHIDFAARRKMVKIFLSHLYVRWRQAANLPIRDPYIFEDHHGHPPTGVPEKFGRSGMMEPPW